MVEPRNLSTAMAHPTMPDGQPLEEPSPSGTPSHAGAATVSLSATIPYLDWTLKQVRTQPVGIDFTCVTTPRVGRAPWTDERFLLYANKSIVIPEGWVPWTIDGYNRDFLNSEIQALPISNGAYSCAALHNVGESQHAVIFWTSNWQLSVLGLSHDHVRTLIDVLLDITAFSPEYYRAALVLQTADFIESLGTNTETLTEDEVNDIDRQPSGPPELPDLIDIQLDVSKAPETLLARITSHLESGQDFQRLQWEIRFPIIFLQYVAYHRGIWNPRVKSLRRILDILKAYSEGTTLDSVGNAFGLTRERIRQIVRDYRWPSATARRLAAREGQRHQLLHQVSDRKEDFIVDWNDNVSREDMAASFGITPGQVAELAVMYELNNDVRRGRIRNSIRQKRDIQRPLIAQRLREAINRTKIKRSKLADAVGIRPSYLHMLLYSRAVPEIYLPALAHALHVPLLWLLEGGGDPDWHLLRESVGEDAEIIQPQTIETTALEPDAQPVIYENDADESQADELGEDDSDVGSTEEDADTVNDSNDSDLSGNQQPDLSDDAPARRFPKKRPSLVMEPIPWRVEGDLLIVDRPDIVLNSQRAITSVAKDNLPVSLESPDHTHRLEMALPESGKPISVTLLSTGDDKPWVYRIAYQPPPSVGPLPIAAITAEAHRIPIFPGERIRLPWKENGYDDLQACYPGLGYRTRTGVRDLVHPLPGARLHHLLVRNGMVTLEREGTAVAWLVYDDGWDGEEWSVIMQRTHVCITGRILSCGPRPLHVTIYRQGITGISRTQDIITYGTQIERVVPGLDEKTLGCIVMIDDGEKLLIDHRRRLCLGLWCLTSSDQLSPYYLFQAFIAAAWESSLDLAMVLLLIEELYRWLGTIDTLVHDAEITKCQDILQGLEEWMSKTTIAHPQRLDQAFWLLDRAEKIRVRRHPIGRCLPSYICPDADAKDLDLLADQQGLMWYSNDLSHWPMAHEIRSLGTTTAVRTHLIELFAELAPLRRTDEPSHLKPIIVTLGPMGLPAGDDLPRAWLRILLAGIPSLHSSQDLWDQVRPFPAALAPSTLIGAHEWDIRCWSLACRAFSRDVTVTEARLLSPANPSSPTHPQHPVRLLLHFYFCLIRCLQDQGISV